MTEPEAPPHPADTVPAVAPQVPALNPASSGTPASQSTMVEQSRAVAEVLAMVEAARRWPRTRAEAIARAEDVCGTMLLAEKAFFEYKRGRTTVLSGSVHLMVELASCWGNVTHGHYELGRDHDRRQSEYMAWAWDLERNYRVAQSFIVEWKRDKTDQAGQPFSAPLMTQRDIYENNANMGARRMREAIRRVLPAWFVELGENACRKTLEDGGGVPLDQRIAKAIADFDGIGVTRSQLERHREGRASNDWTPYDLAQLHIARVSIHRRELNVEDVFPSEAPTAAEIAAQAEASP